MVDDFTGDVTCDTTDRKVCHMAVGKIQQGGHALVLGKYRFHGEMKFMMWDESKWSKLGEYIRNDKTSKRIKIRVFQELIEDIADGTVNGHSFIIYRKKFFIDPHFSSAGVSFNDIQKIGRWFEKAFQNIGIRHA